MRVALTEQTYRAVYLLSLGGLTGDQSHVLFLTVGAAGGQEPNRLTACA